MCYEQAINYLLGREAEPGVDYLLQDDGEGVYMSYWNISDTLQPSMETINDVVSNISFAVQFEELRAYVTEMQLKAQKKIVLLADKFALDLTDQTKTLIMDAKTALIGAGRTQTTLIDFQGNPNTISLDDIDLILGNETKGIIGQFSVARLDLHEQEIEILRKALMGEPYEVQFYLTNNEGERELC